MKSLVTAFLVGNLLMATAAEVGRSRLVLPEGAENPALNLLRTENWEAFGRGFVREPDGSFRCDNGSSAELVSGAHQQLRLHQSEARPVVISGWSRAENVGGSRDGDYSLYGDIFFTDGSVQWAQTAPFPVGTQEWNRRELRLDYAQPIDRIEVYALFRNHSGTAWFRSLQASEPTGENAVFDGLPVTVAGRKAAGFLLRDVAADGDFVAFDQSGRAAALELQVETRRLADKATAITATLRNPEAVDRAVTLYYTLPLPDGEWSYWEGLQENDRKLLAKSRDYQQFSGYEIGNGRNTTLPFAAVTGEGTGLAIGFQPDLPAFGRVAANGATGELFIAFDLALPPEAPAATVGLVIFEFEPEWGQRAAWQRYYELFPEAFRRRVPKQGNWMAFEKISGVEGWEDFGFAFKEGDNEPAWDAEHGILTFRYTEPMTWWMKMDAPPKDLDDALRYLALQAKEGNPEAQAILNSGMYDESGSLAGRRENTPWCNGVVWSANSMPKLTAQPSNFSLRWNSAIFRRCHGPEAPVRLAGEYVDSSEGYVTIPFSFRRDHFAAAETPLTFDRSFFRPGIFRGLVALEYIRAIARDIHAAGSYMMANATPHNLWFLAPQLDVMGTEANWFPEGVWRPQAMTDLRRIRAICAQKPFCFIMNTDFTTMPPEQLEKYFQRTVALGMFPGFFSADASTGHYFSQPALYNRDRWLFRKYLPAAIAIAEAGWQPVTLARTAAPDICLERFGNRYLTIYNSSDQPAAGRIVIDPAWKVGSIAVELLSGKPWNKEEEGWPVSLQPDELQVIDFGPAAAVAAATD